MVVQLGEELRTDVGKALNCLAKPGLHGSGILETLLQLVLFVVVQVIILRSVMQSTIACFPISVSSKAPGLTLGP